MKRKIKKKIDQATLLREVLQQTPRVTPPCRHFRECGGCEIQQYEYPAQVDAKLEVFRRMIEEKKLKAFAAVEVQSMASPRPLGYRQKMDFVCAFEASGLRSRFDKVVELEECLLIEEESFKVYRRALDLARAASLEFYNYLEYRGYLRYITVRRTRLGQQFISFLTTSAENEEVMNSMAETILAEGLANGVLWQITGDRGDTSFGTPHRHWGVELIEEELLGRRFKLSANTFFQANLEVAQEAYRQIVAHASSFQPKTILDLYSGTCTIGICLSECAEKIIAVENFQPNRDMAMLNFAANDIKNIEYIAQDVAEYMEQSDLQPDFAVCNPPRKGVDERPLRELMKRRPKGISYLSCNPKSLLDDLSIMTLHYDIISASVLDMFPQTHHFETLVHLKLKND